MRKQARDLTFKFGEQLRKEGYRGYFELDFLIDKKTGDLWLGELNPRITGASSMTNHAAFAHADAPLFLFHLLEFSRKKFQLDVDELNARWADPDMIDSWSQMVIKHTEDSVDICTEAPETGIYKMLEDGRVVFDRFDYHRRAVESENEAFFLRILQPGRLSLRGRRSRHPGDARPVDDQGLPAERARQALDPRHQAGGRGQAAAGGRGRPGAGRSGLQDHVGTMARAMMLWRALTEDAPGPKWAGLFAEYWPDYQRWWLKEGEACAPDLPGEPPRAANPHARDRAALRPSFASWPAAAIIAARFLSFYCPPPYLSGCSQAIWPGQGAGAGAQLRLQPRRLRQPDPAHRLAGAAGDGHVSDGLWGLVDGMNDAGLALSLTFGGRRVVGDGFGVPLILRYVLQTCETAEEAGAVLARVPTHMSYNVTVLDRSRRYLTAMMAPDRPAVITHAAVATNHQEAVEWVSHARFTATVERERFLLQRLTLHRDPQEKFIERLPEAAALFDRLLGRVRHALHRRLPAAQTADGGALAGHRLADGDVRFHRGRARRAPARPRRLTALPCAGPGAGTRGLRPSRWRVRATRIPR